jgi:hypothetical protein
MKESGFSAEITTTFKKMGILSRKIADTPFSPPLLQCPICRNEYRNPLRGFAHKKPFDRIAIIGNHIVGIEEKITKSNTFPLKDLRTKHRHQLENLKDAEFGYFFINFRCVRKGRSHNVIKILKGSEMLKIINSSDKSISLFKKDGSVNNDIGRYALRKHGMWDLSWVMNQVTPKSIIYQKIGKVQYQGPGSEKIKLDVARSLENKELRNGIKLEK